MTNEEKELLAAYQSETEKCYDIAQLLDGQNPLLTGAFTGTPSERIVRQLQARGVAPFDVKTPW